MIEIQEGSLIDDNDDEDDDDDDSTNSYLADIKSCFWPPETRGVKEAMK